MASIPRLQARRTASAGCRDPGIVPSLREPIVGCAFAPRCAYAVERCRARRRRCATVGDGHVVACHEAERVLATAVAA